MTVPGYALRRPAGDPLPLIFDSPHSGRCYPASFRYLPPLAVLRRAEDAYVDQLLAGAHQLGATVLLAEYPRCFIDPNRDLDDLDPELLREPWPTPLNPGGKSRQGLGLVRRYVVPGVPVQRELLSSAEVRERIEVAYEPYHRALAALLEEARGRAGFAWHIDWHSMKSVGNAMTPDPDQRRPDFAVGDRGGTSSEPALTELVAGFLRDRGYTVSVNGLYEGGHIVRRYGAPEKGLHSVQIEINRALYLDEVQVECHAGAVKLRVDIDELTHRLARALRERLGT